MNASTTDFMSRGPVAFFTINRPEAGNAMTWAMYDALVDACERVDADSGLRAFVIRAAGGVFCTGTDISQFTAFSTREDGLGVRAPSRVVRGAARAGDRADDRPGGGDCGRRRLRDRAGLRPARVLAPARFGVPIARTLGNGLSFENCARLVEHFGMARTRTMLITGGFVDAAEAAACGVVTRLADPADVERSSTTWSRRSRAMLRSRFAPRRRHWDGSAARSRSDAGEIADLVADCYASADFREGVSAFLSKRRQSSPAADSGVLHRLAPGEQGERGVHAAAPEGHAGRGQAQLDAAERADEHQLVEVTEVPDAERARPSAVRDRRRATC